MIYKKCLTKYMALSCLSVLALSACSNGTTLRSPFTTKAEVENAKYWQRSSASSALYLQGPKAQQMLHRNIATCTNEIKELERLGEIRRAVPATYNNGSEAETRTASQKTLDSYESPARDGYLRNEGMDYHDFETCMHAKGWKRAKYLPYAEADVARQNYLDRHGKQKKIPRGERENVTTLHKTSTNFPTQDGVNE